MDSKVIGHDNEEWVHLAYDGNQCVLQLLGPPVRNLVPTLTVNVVFRLQESLVSGNFEGEDTTFRQKPETDSTLSECGVTEERNPQVNRCENLKKLVVGNIILLR